MPNIVTHMEIAFRSGIVDTDVVLGSALPDFVAVFSDYHQKMHMPDLDLGEGFSKGKTIHQKTDDVFDSMPGRRIYTANVRAELALAAPRLSVGAQRMCADAGTKIMLDGARLEDPVAFSVFEAVREQILDGKTSIRTVGNTALSDFMVAYFEERRAFRYHDPESVAEIMFRRLEARQSRFMLFPESEILPVAEVFNRQLTHYRFSGALIVQQLVDSLIPIEF